MNNIKTKHLLKSVGKNHSILRAFENELVRSINLSGKGIDLGAKSKDAKYYEFMSLNEVREIDFVDFFSSEPGIIQLNLEEPFDIKENSYDFLLMFNVMEHIYNYRNLMNEAVRVLRPGGVMHGLVPFMWHFHPDPNDYFRFSEQALKKVLEENNVRKVEVYPICYGPFKVAASNLCTVLRSKIFRMPIFWLAIKLDLLFEKYTNGAHRYAMGYYFTVTKE